MISRKLLTTYVRMPASWVSRSLTTSLQWQVIGARLVFKWWMLTLLCYQKHFSEKFNFFEMWNVSMSFSAGLKAKEKREKEKSSATSRPPTRRGAHSADQSVPTPSSHVASSCLCHLQMPSQYFLWCIGYNTFDKIKSYAKTTGKSNQHSSHLPAP